MVYSAATISDLKNDNIKRIYCFGAGKLFDFFVQNYVDIDVDFRKKIEAVVDNHLERMDANEKRFSNICIPIISLDQLICSIEPNDCILITTKAYEEIIHQLEGIDSLSAIRCFIYSMLVIEQKDSERSQVAVPSRLSSYTEILIPKTIHYCWFGRQPIPSQYQKWMESWRQYCPDYEIIEWNENNYDVHKCKYISQAYEKGQWAFVSDYARIDIINSFGGVYLDTDVELLRNIDELLMNKGFCGFESPLYINYGLGFGAQKRHPIMEEIKGYYDKTDFVLHDGTLNKVTSPVIQTEIMRKHGLKCNGEFQIIKGMATYPARVLCGMSLDSFRIERNSRYTYAIHHFEGSWLTKEVQDKKNEFITKMKRWSPNDNYIYLDEA